MLSPDTEAAQQAQIPARQIDARKLCYLERGLLSDCAPLGFCAWDIVLAPSVARDTSGWVPRGDGGRVLFHAPQEMIYRGAADTPDRMMPLLLVLTHRSLRVLYQCAPPEAYHLGKRLATLGARALGAAVVEECSPAALADLLYRWLGRDPRCTAMFPVREGEEDRPQLTPWVHVWSEDRLLTLPERSELSSTARYAPPLHLRWRPAEVLVYDDGPFTLVPVGMLMESPDATQERIQSLYAEQEDLVHGSLLSDTHTTVITWTIGQLTAVLAPLHEEGWREQLVNFRDALDRRLGCPVACIPVRQRTTASLIRSLREIQDDLHGSDEVNPAPYEGAATAPPEGTRARELRRRLGNAVALPFPDELLHPLPA
jgi:hypothetical protein